MSARLTIQSDQTHGYVPALTGTGYTLFDQAGLLYHGE